MDAKSVLYLAGHGLRPTPCLIALLAAEHDVLLLAKDRDLIHILESGFCGAKGLPV